MAQYDTYEQVEAYILSIPKFAKKIGTESLIEILAFLGHPERLVPAIHVAGTNGKGSTCAYMQSVYMQAGYHVGMFTSPHLVRMNERIRIDHGEIEDEDFVACFQEIHETVMQQGFSYPSFFEMLFLIAVLYFAKKKPDLVIYETGMGGRLDATNVLAPKLCVITSIGYDHMQYLGDTIEKIAYEKAGIIKEHTPVIYFKRDPVSAEVIEKQAAKMHAPCVFVEKNDYMVHKITTKNIDFSIDSRYYKCDSVKIPATGLYQVENAVLAASAVKLLESTSVGNEDIRQGLAAMYWEGRMEQLMPDVWIDGAHNEEAILCWIDTLKQLYADSRNRLVFAVANDKDYVDMIRHIGTQLHFEKIYITTIPGARRTDCEYVKEQFARNTSDVLCVIEDTKEALFTACRERPSDQKLFIVGSLYLVGAVKQWQEELIRYMEQIEG